MNTNIPFYSNAPDDTHCFQASIKMIAKYFWPQEDYSWEQLDKYTAKIKDLWTWQMAGALWMQEKGVEIIDIEIFDYEKFIEEKNNYLLSFFGQETGTEQIKHSNIEQEIKYARIFQEKINIQNKIPDKKDLINLLENKYLLICCINSQTLNQKKGYVGHFVVVKGYDKDGLFLHDPGLPPHENIKVSFDLFEKSWAYPDEKVKNILAFRLKSIKK
jgi:hypothetical protein